MNRLLVFVLMLVASTAFGAHATSNLDSLAAGVTARQSASGVTPRETKALAAAARLLARNTTTESADIALAASVAKILERSFPRDEELLAELDAAVTVFRDDLLFERKYLSELLIAVPFGKNRRAAQQLAARAEKLAHIYYELSTYDSRATKLSYLARWAAVTEKATRAAVGSQNWLTAYIAGDDEYFIATDITAEIDVSGTLTLSASERRPRGRTVVSRRIDMVAHQVVGASAGVFALDDDGTKLSIIGPDGGVGASWYVIDSDPGFLTVVSTNRANLLEGDFQFSARLSPTASRVEVNGGRFHVRLTPP